MANVFWSGPISTLKLPHQCLPDLFAADAEWLPLSQGLSKRDFVVHPAMHNRALHTYEPPQLHGLCHEAFAESGHFVLAGLHCIRMRHSILLLKYELSAHTTRAFEALFT